MFAVPMAPVQEIIRVPEVARMPLAPPALDGLANLRGRVLPIVNLRRLFGTEERANDDATRALVINLGQPLGFVVDRVASVVSVEPGEIEAAGSIQSMVQADYLTGVIKRSDADGQRQLMLVLDFERLVERAVQRRRRAARSRGGRQRQRSATAVAGERRPPGRRAAPGELHRGRAGIRDRHRGRAGDRAGAGATSPRCPTRRSHVLGLMTLRQRLLPLVSLRTHVRPARRWTPDEHHRIVVVALPGGAPVGLVTDTVKEVLSVPRAQADAMPGVLARDEQLQEFESICRLDGGKRLVSIIASRQAAGHAGHPRGRECRHRRGCRREAQTARQRPPTARPPT